MLTGLKVLLQSRYGLDLGTILAEVGLDPGHGAGPAGQSVASGESISLNAYSRMLEIAAERSADECLGLHFAHAFPRGGTRALGYLMLNAPDLGTCLDCLCRYVRLQADAVEFELAESEGIARLVIAFGAPFVAPRKQLVEFVCALIVLRVTTEFGDGWLPLSTDFEYRAPSCSAGYAAVFGPNIRFNRPQTVITMRSDVLKRQSQRADERLFALIKDIADSELAHLDRSQDIAWLVSDHIVRTLQTRAVTLDSAAAAVGRTPRQLQNDLKRSGTTFEEQMGAARKALAERYLRDTDFTMTEIALLLGFSELSAFTRAARAWLGMPPSQWRQQARGAGPGEGGTA
ncbi:MAG: AraC family transcriptional regulator [Hyphomicrobiaceae bacterium]|nr:AraC family transcriptional regulator [Hyphomicrobiaceae bacterium]